LTPAAAFQRGRCFSAMTMIDEAIKEFEKVVLKCLKAIRAVAHENEEEIKLVKIHEDSVDDSKSDN
jgi:uncharacterized protein with PhoU and TrkA domain